MTKTEIEEARATFPQYTVYLCYHGGQTTGRTGDYYAECGKTYQECTEALKKDKTKIYTTL